MKPNPGEVSEIQWMKRENLKEQIKSLESPLTPWFKLIYESGQLELWWKNLNRLKKFEDYQKIHKLE